MNPSPHARHYDLRTALHEALTADLLGPVGGTNEVLVTDAPVTAYPIGVLFPQRVGNTVPTLEEEVDSHPTPDFVRQDDVDEAFSESGVSLANRRRPSSMGLTFVVDLAVATELSVVVRSAIYRPEDSAGNAVEPHRSEARTLDRQDENWRREELVCPETLIDVRRVGALEPIRLVDGLELRILVRKPARDGTSTVTVSLVNAFVTGEYDLQDAYCFFQTELEVCDPRGERPFVERRVANGAIDEDQALSGLLHRHAPTFAIGHGCSGSWDWHPPAPRSSEKVVPAVSAVRTRFIPVHEVMLTDSNPEIDDEALGMERLAAGSRTEVVAALRRLVDAYGDWIDDRSIEAAALAGTEHANVASEQITVCRSALARMRSGISLLEDEGRPEVLRAFQLANSSMARQRARTAWIRGGRQRRPNVELARWRPFQIAFLLLCLDGIVDSDHSDREVADLLWFPTGGGKTEAYLGLVAFTVFLRRLRDPIGGVGVTVLMRYTLRLLTLQQFERATALICSMEVVRRGNPFELGETPVSIGMWVGRSATPNTLARASDRLDDLTSSRGEDAERSGGAKSLTSENPVQLEACPWCGEKITARAYRVDEAAQRMYVHCPDRDCDFAGGTGLPVHLVDEAVYSAHPTMVIATVDKFASLPWRPATRALFNLDLPDVSPPELIVQDELHLISGPLGTLVGLYETAVDVLARRPKIIASTATIRRASRQVRSVFDRTVAQFPPAGLDSRDSWFAVEASKDEKASRLYVGLSTSTTSQASLLIRAYAALLHAGWRSEAGPDVVDAYWTLVGYFNSLRLLSAAELQVLDDVQDRLESLAKRDESGDARIATALIEMSSRADSSAVPRYLKLLERRYGDPDVLDVVLATNMIAVGVDIDRLGLMAIMGQPQTTAEYIQASSRVGRSHPGLIAVMFNSARSRDRSHYENFQGFHSALYREVESTSVTPFSVRSRDRGLHAVLIALTRLLIPAASDNRSAADVESFVDDINEIVRPLVLERVRSVDDAEYEAAARQFDEILLDWRDAAAEDPDLVYGSGHGSERHALLAGFDLADGDPGVSFPTLWSLRDVDAESELFLDNGR